MENKYFAELARRLRAAGITAGHPEKNRLTVLLNNQPVLSVSAGSDVFLLPAGSNQPEAGELYHKVAQTADEVYAYVEAVQTAPLLHASGLSEKFHLLADFGGAVLAGRELENGWGYQFVTWIWDHDRTGVSHAAHLSGICLPIHSGAVGSRDYWLSGACGEMPPHGRPPEVMEAGQLSFQREYASSCAGTGPSAQAV